MKIARVKAREILDSRGIPTVEADVFTSSGVLGRASVPSGASTGTHEAVELRDGNPNRYAGKGVLTAVENIENTLGPALVGTPCDQQQTIDLRLREMDGTENKSRLGANALLAVSLACARAAALERKVPLWRHLDPGGMARLPLPMVNMISGGLHAGGNLDFQDFLYIPCKARSYPQALEQIATVYHTLGKDLKKARHEGALVGDEGGYGPKLRDESEALTFLSAAMGSTGGGIALDVASTRFFQREYRLRAGNLSGKQMATHLSNLVMRFPIISIEDGCAEDDWDGWKVLTNLLGEKVQLIGDDLFVTNPTRVRRGIKEKAANAVLVKVNQIGTLTESFEVLKLARENGYRAVVSARSGETEDDFLADFATASGCGQIKVGSIARGERLAKYNRLLRINEEMGPSAPFGPPSPLPQPIVLV